MAVAAQVRRITLFSLQLNQTNTLPPTGNIGIERTNSASTPADLQTPTIKAATYTTGRGGSGNMASNDPSKPEVARAAQDVAAPAHKQPETAVHVGRGGGGNVATLTDAQSKAAKEENDKAKRNSTEEKGGVKGLLEKVGLKK